MESLRRRELAELVRWIHQKGWAPGTGGNFSRLVSLEPFRLLMTPSGADKGSVGEDDLLLVDEHGKPVGSDAVPSAETLLHIPIIRQTGADTVIHTHTIWNTLTSLWPGEAYEITGLEMLKGLSGVRTHEHVEQIPILENSQDMINLSAEVSKTIQQNPGLHAILLRGHGLYTWGSGIFEARRHAEILEFLFEVTQRQRQLE